jgi:hypothetical protein
VSTVSTPWDFEDYPEWLGADPEDPAPAEAEASDIPLQSLVLDLRERPAIPNPVLDFLRDYAEAHDIDPTTYGFGDFLAAIWPSGVPTTVYASNVGYDPNAPSHLRSLLLRPVCEGPLAALPGLGALTLGLHVVRHQAKLAVRRIEVTPHVHLRDFEVRVSAPLIWDHPDAFMDRRDFEALAGLPFHRAKTAERLTDWRKYLDWKERLIRANQVTMPYAAWRWEDEAVVGFLVHEDHLPERRLIGMELGASVRPSEDEDEDDGAENGLRRRPRRRRDPEVTQLGEVDSMYQLNPRDARDRDGWGDVKLTSKHRCVRIRVDEDVAELLRRRGPPDEGQLVSSIAGDLAPLQNQKAGVNRLNNSQGFSPRLADFIFSSASASVPVYVPELPEVPGGRSLNAGQRDAVAKALAAPDLCLIQGPPGTGKTTVISEICLRASREGKRVLVASQTNLAVDNALARLADVPWVRPLRLGDPGKVDDEFRDFLAENVVQRWFATIADHCRARMRDAEHRAASLATLERAVDELARSLDAQNAAEEAAWRAASRVSGAQMERDRCKSVVEIAREQRTRLARRLETLLQFARWASEGAVLPAEAAAEPWPASLRRLTDLDTAAPPLVALDSLAARRDALQALLVAIDRARGGAVADVAAAEELRKLREEKRSLVDSEEEADMRRLRSVNGRIKDLEGGGWNQLTGGIDRAARIVWPSELPSCIDLVVGALRPSPDTRAAIEEARTLVEAALLVAAEAAELVRASRMHWDALASKVQHNLETAGASLAAGEGLLAKSEDAITRAHDEQRAARAAQDRALAAWQAGWRMVSPDADPGRGPSPEALVEARERLNDARQHASARLGRAKRWSTVQAEWIDRLGNVSDSDREQLQALYVRHSNVVGMTCNEAGKRKTWQDPSFAPFDIVIVDEVSKATPPELILPLLLGQKAILVGDHRQLPPMFRERDASFSEASEEGEITKADFERFRRMVTASLFEELFERAPDEIKAMLWTQYRMHPRIMDAINQFYEGRLEAGPDRDTLSASRVHHLTVADAAGGRLLTPTQHLLWIDTTNGPDGKPIWEDQRGSSKVNLLEVKVTVALLIRLGAALAERGYGVTREFETPRGAAGNRWDDVVRREAPDLPTETIADLFTERRIRVDGRAQRPDGAARAGATVQIRAQKEVGVITFYGAQLKELRQAIDRARGKHRAAFASMEIRTNTVDRFQGMEKPIVIASLVRAKRGKLGDFVREFQRINVGLSRAQQLLVVVGAEDTWKNAEVPLPPLDGGAPIEVAAYRNILELARQAGGRRLARQLLPR